MINFPFSRFVGKKIIGMIGDISISRPIGYRIMFKNSYRKYRYRVYDFWTFFNNKFSIK